MKVKFENVDFSSRSGPNGFGLKLARQMIKDGHEVVDHNQDACLSFIQSSGIFKPNVLRLDGIYFNTSQDWQEMNKPLKKSYDLATAVVVQSNFDKKMIDIFFGKRDNVTVISNGTDVDVINSIPVGINHDILPRNKVWMCASAWRPHKRLEQNITLFQEKADRDCVLFVAGSGNIDDIKKFKDDRIKFVGDLSWPQMISLMKSAGNFVHLAWLDHCPNVVVDAKAAGCKLHVASSGGTHEITDKNDVVYKDAIFEFNPLSLYEPPKMDFEEDTSKRPDRVDVSIVPVAEKYYSILRSVV
jgi:hypothetical protein